jgi:hypothetical protein
MSISCLKQHTCVSCASKFSYVLARKVTGQAATEAGATANAEKAAVKAIENDADFHPCPVCGIVQPDMLADVRSGRFWFGAVAGVIGAAAALILGLTQVVTIATSAYVCAAAAGVVLLIYVWGCLYNPNRNPEANRMASEQQMSLGKLALNEKPDSFAGPVVDEHGGWTAGHMAALVLTFVAVGVAAAPPLLSGLNGWAVNESCHPPVVGPGDTTCFYFDSTIVSVNGMWNGSVNATVSNAPQPGLPALRATTKHSSWGNTISGKSVSNSTNKMWAQVHFPEDPQWSGKPLELDLAVSANFPFEYLGGFVEKRGTFSHHAAVTLSTPGAGTIYHRAWWMGQLGVLLLVIVSCAVLLGTCKSLRQRGHPTAVAALEPRQ